MLDFVRQLYDKRWWWVMGGLVFFYIVAFSVQESLWAWVPLVAIGAAVFGISLYKLEYGLALAILEIFMGGHGHLLQVPFLGLQLSLREVIFAAVMAAWLILFLSKRVKPMFVSHRDWPFAVLVLAVLIGNIKGFATNDPAAAFDDMNGYLTLGYFLPMISVQWTNESRRLLLQTFAVSAIWVAATTLVFVYGFTHLPGLTSHEVYTFVRDARIAEVTLQTSGPVVDYLGNAPWYFRVFQQSQVVIGFFEMLLIAATLMLWREPQEKLPWFVSGLHALFMAGIIASLSRSIWIGAVAGFAVVLIFALITRPKAQTLIKRHAQLGMFTIISAFVLFLLVALPLPPRPDITESSFYSGRDENTREVAVSSRWNLLRPMVDEIWKSPIIGSGFGETVTYISDDPRLRAINPSGEVTTYRFEWGYHDIWLKMGVLGLLGFGWIFVTIISVVFESVMRRDSALWIKVGLAGGVASLFIVNIFSPYLNHPIGLMFLIFLLPFLPWEKALEEKETADATKVAPLPLTEPAVGAIFQPRD